MPADLQAWERQDGESDGAYDAFRGYIDQTPPRRLVHASVKLRPQQLSALYNEWRWEERALAYDRYHQKIRDAEREALLREDEKTRTAAQLTIIKGIHQVANREIAKLVRDCEKSEAFGTVRVSELNKMIGQVIVLERLIHGESTENVGMVDVDLKKLTVEELREFQRLQAKLSASADDDEEEAVH